MGVLSTDAILVHSSMKSIGEVEGGADTVLDAFMEYFADGLFMMPTHTWNNCRAGAVFDPEKSPCCVGILPELFRKRPGVIRSLHPTHSIAAFGSSAAEYTAYDNDPSTVCPPDGCFGRLREIGAKILLLGVNHGRNTYIHSVEESLGLADRLTEGKTPLLVRMPDGGMKEVSIQLHHCSKARDVSAHYVKLSDAFEALGAARRVKFGDADCILCDAAKIYEVCEKIFGIEPDAIIDRETIPEEWWK